MVLADLTLAFLISNMQSMIRKTLQDTVFVRQSRQRNAKSTTNMMKGLKAGTPNTMTKVKMDWTLNIVMMKVTI